MVDQRTLHLINDDTLVEESRTVELGLPQWIWGFIQSRAGYHHEGNMEKALEEIVAIGINTVLAATIESITDIPEPSDKGWN